MSMHPNITELVPFDPELDEVGDDFISRRHNNIDREESRNATHNNQGIVARQIPTTSQAVVTMGTNPELLDSAVQYMQKLIKSQIPEEEMANELRRIMVVNIMTPSQALLTTIPEEENTGDKPQEPDTHDIDETEAWIETVPPEDNQESDTGTTKEVQQKKQGFRWTTPPSSEQERSSLQWENHRLYGLYPWNQNKTNDDPTKPKEWKWESIKTSGIEDAEKREAHRTQKESENQPKENSPNTEESLNNSGTDEESKNPGQRATVEEVEDKDHQNDEKRNDNLSG
jgi:hypothetical protein